MKKKIFVSLVAIAIVLLMVGVVYLCLPKKPDGTADMIERSEIAKYTEEMLRDKLIGQYRGDILVSWGEPNSTHAELNCDVFYLEGTYKSIIVVYDDEYCVERISIDKDIQSFD